MSKLDKILETIVEGNDFQVPLLSSENVRYINLDNAASTPPFKGVLNKINEFTGVYASVHRGNGYKSLLCTEIYEETRRIVADFIGVDINENSIIYTKNATEAINKLANCFQFNDGDIIICTRMEHHSNDLPWRKKAVVKYIEVKENGELDLEHYKKLLCSYKDRIKLVTVTGASNVTGYINPIHYMASLAHAVGAKIFVDGSQLVPHRKVNMKNNKDESHIDFLAFTAHKMYAPFGAGVLVGPKSFFNNSDPDILGGGIVKMVTDKEIFWEDTPEKNEAGTPNVIGAVALAAAIKIYESLDLDKIQKHEEKLTGYVLEKLKTINRVKIYGYPEEDSKKRTGVVSFSMDGVNHSLLSSILSYEYGIGVRSGCFCAHPYVLRLLGIGESSLNKYKNLILNGDKSNVPGLVRISFGVYNTIEEIDRLVDALKNISEGKYATYHVVDKRYGNYVPVNWNSSISSLHLHNFWL